MRTLLHKIFWYCIFIVFLTVYTSSVVNAQSSKLNGGLGFGLDYGGILGAKVIFQPIKYIGVFGSVGLYNYETGYNIGVQLKYPMPKLIPYFTGMYGSNAWLESEVIITRNQYYGPTIGGGIELITKNEKGFWNFGVLIPFRDDQLQRDVDALKSQGLTVYSSTWPVTISLGYHFFINKLW